ncbi:hypothetical protein BCR33DRAFT_733545 [Rhizoclosmatium globosum]|uniref:CCHC-type domain-containing protein n=1 Tax=Rhizoclosmatium globosum TaxID=329046 RepID=A0A1Y2D0A5_9FUNG|nr:hypothetical protein BCR33DRAFT_733545 [Rhizoclosmatium globosum]|eukprot:ORY52025.1 hypothetical protein BCR33DRAFT_733545 [Rhizoclosmatium globosum]
MSHHEIKYKFFVLSDYRRENLETFKKGLISYASEKDSHPTCDTKCINETLNPGINENAAIAKHPNNSATSIEKLKWVLANFIPHEGKYYRLLDDDNTKMVFPGTRKMNNIAIGLIRNHTVGNVHTLIKDLNFAHEAISAIEAQVSALEASNSKKTHNAYVNIQMNNGETASAYIARFSTLYASAKVSGKKITAYSEQLDEKWAFGVFLDGMNDVKTFKPFVLQHRNTFSVGKKGLVNIYAELQQFAGEENDQQPPPTATANTVVLPDQPLHHDPYVNVVLQQFPTQNPNWNQNPAPHLIANAMGPRPPFRPQIPTPFMYAANRINPPAPAQPSTNSNPNPNLYPHPTNPGLMINCAYHGRFLKDGVTPNPHFLPATATRPRPLGNPSHLQQYHPYQRSPGIRPPPNPTTPPARPPRPPNSGLCFTCGEPGHIAINCPHRTANVAASFDQSTYYQPFPINPHYYDLYKYYDNQQQYDEYNAYDPHPNKMKAQQQQQQDDTPDWMKHAEQEGDQDFQSAHGERGHQPTHTPHHQNLTNIDPLPVPALSKLAASISPSETDKTCHAVMIDTGANLEVARDKKYFKTFTQYPRPKPIGISANASAIMAHGHGHAVIPAKGINNEVISINLYNAIYSPSAPATLVPQKSLNKQNLYYFGYDDQSSHESSIWIYQKGISPNREKDTKLIDIRCKYGLPFIPTIDEPPRSTQYYGSVHSSFTKVRPSAMSSLTRKYLSDLKNTLSFNTERTHKILGHISYDRLRFPYIPSRKVGPESTDATTPEVIAHQLNALSQEDLNTANQQIDIFLKRKERFKNDPLNPATLKVRKTACHTKTLTTTKDMNRKALVPEPATTRKRKTEAKAAKQKRRADNNTLQISKQTPPTSQATSEPSPLPIPSDDPPSTVDKPPDRTSAQRPHRSNTNYDEIDGNNDDTSESESEESDQDGEWTPGLNSLVATICRTLNLPNPSPNSFENTHPTSRKPNPQPRSTLLAIVKHHART